MSNADVPLEVRPIQDESIRGGSTFDQVNGQKNRPDPRIHDSGIIGYARYLSHPAYERLVQSEALLKQLVPVLIVILLVIIGTARWLSLSEQAEDITNNTKQELYFIAELLDEMVSGALGDGSNENLNDTEVLQNILATAIPARYFRKDRIILINNQQGKIISSLPFKAGLVGKSLEYPLGDISLLTTFGRRADFREITTPEFGKAIVLHRLLDKNLGGVSIVQPTVPLFASWRHTIHLNVTLFVATSTILLVVLYAYFAQVARAREADDIYHKTNARFETALNRGRCGLWDWNLERGTIYWSSSMFNLLGQAISQDVLSFKSVSELIHPEDINLYNLANEVIENNQSHMDRMFRMRHMNGDWIWIRNRCEIVVSDEGEKHMIGIAVDVTEQERIKALSVEKDSRLRDAIESLSQAFVLWDNKKRLIMCNSNFMRMHQLPPNLIQTGMGFSEVMSHSEKPLKTKTVLSADRMLNGTSMEEAELEDGRCLQISERRTSDGGYVSVSTDITAHKRQASKLLDSQNRLKKTVADLTESQHKAEIQAKQLSELAQKYANEKNNAEKASKIKSEFLANISHEWRTPLNAIIGFSEIMVQKTFGPIGDERYVDYARDINSSGIYLLGVINDILDVSKIEAGRLELDFEPCNIDEIVDESIRIVNYQTNEKNIKVRDETCNNMEVEADRRAIKQIMVNLMSNAAKFSPRDGQIVVRSKPLENSLLLTICDNGIGIGSEDLKRLGRPFEQVQNQLTKDHKGSGLGLAITRSLVEAHHGSFRIKSKPGAGTVVSLCLPLKQKSAVAEAA